VLAETPYSFGTRFENEKGTNPEELIAAAHAECFSMTLAFVLQGAAYSPTELDVEAAVTIEPEGQGFRISRSALTLHAQVPNDDWSEQWKRHEQSSFRFGGSSRSRHDARDVLRDEMQTDEIATEAFLSRCQVAVHSMIVNEGESHESADGYHIPRPTG
jgi:hypothetical protein